MCGGNLRVARNRGLVSVNLKWRGLEGNDGVCINLRWCMHGSVMGFRVLCMLGGFM